MYVCHTEFCITRLAEEEYEQMVKAEEERITARDYQPKVHHTHVLHASSGANCPIPPSPGSHEAKVCVVLNYVAIVYVWHFFTVHFSMLHFRTE